MFLCSNMCPQHDCFPGFHSKKNSERLEGLFHRRIFLPTVLAKHVRKRSRDILLRQNEYAVCKKMNNLYYLLDGNIILNFIDNNNRKSIPYEFIKENAHLIKEGITPALDYIKVINEIYF